MSKSKSIVLGLVLVLMTASAVWAEDDWQYEVAPYLWAMSAKGDVTVRGQTESFDMRIEDIFDAVEVAGGLMLAAQQGHFRAVGQFDYFTLDTDRLESAPSGGSLRTNIFLGGAAAGYVFYLPMEGSQVALMLGPRYTNIKNDLNVTGVGQEYWKSTQDLLDALFVVSPSFRLAKRWNFMMPCSVGGGDSDLLWDIMPTIQFKFNDLMGLLLSYRQLHIETSSVHNNHFDSDFYGAGLGLSFNF